MATGLGKAAVARIREAKYTPAMLLLVVGNSSVDSDVVTAFRDSAFVRDAVRFSRGQL